MSHKHPRTLRYCGRRAARRSRASASHDLVGAKAEDIIRWARETFGDHVLISQSMANTALAHLVHRYAPDIPVVFLDTGYHFDETLATRDDLERRTASDDPARITPLQTVAEQDARVRPGPVSRDPDLCCRLRKVEPHGGDARSATTRGSRGMRKASARRTARASPIASFDERRGMLKVNPLAATGPTTTSTALHAGERRPREPADVRGLPVDRLRARAPTPSPRARTRGPAAGAGCGKIECGLHA